MSEREAGIGQDREVVFVMDDARVSLRAARDGVVSLHSRIAASLRALDEVESAQRQAAAGGAGGQEVVGERVRELARELEGASAVGREVEHRLMRTRADWQAAGVIAGGLEPVSVQDRVDRAGVLARSGELTRLVGEAGPPLRMAVTALARAAVSARDLAPPQREDLAADGLPVGSWHRDLTRARAGGARLDESLASVSRVADRAAGHVDGMVAAARARMAAQGRRVVPGAASTPPAGVRR